jgi:hypothetical protein
MLPQIRGANNVNRKLFDIISARKNEFFTNINFTDYSRMNFKKDTELSYQLSKIGVDLTPKSDGFNLGFVLSKEGDKVYVKVENDVPPLKAMFVHNVLYNMGLGPKTDFLVNKFQKYEDFIILSKDLEYSKNKNNRHFEIGLTPSRESQKVVLASKILNLDDVSNEKNAGIVSKDNKKVGKIFDFIVAEKRDKDIIKENFPIKKTEITKDQLFSNVKLDKEGNLLSKNQRKHINPNNKASFETIINVSYNQTLSKYEEIFNIKPNVKELNEYKADVLKVGKKEIEALPNIAGKLLGRR